MKLTLGDGALYSFPFHFDEILYVRPSCFSEFDLAAPVLLSLKDYFFNVSFCGRLFIGADDER
jgi:hypothetical protein